MLVFLFLPSLPIWLAITLPLLVFMSWLELRDLQLRPIMVFWWLLVVLIIYVPGWVALKVYAVRRRRYLPEVE